jgi:hypothetical protein
MLRHLVMAFCVGIFALGLGCGGSESKVDNPGNLEYSKEGPPKRDGPGAPQTGNEGKPVGRGRVPGQPK